MLISYISQRTNGLSVITRICCILLDALQKMCLFPQSVRTPHVNGFYLPHAIDTNAGFMVSCSRI